MITHLKLYLVLVLGLNLFIACDDSPKDSSSGGDMVAYDVAGVMAGEDAGSIAGEDAGSMAGEDAGSMAGEDAGSMAGEDAGSMAGDSAGEVAGNEMPMMQEEEQTEVPSPEGFTAFAE